MFGKNKKVKKCNSILTTILSDQNVLNIYSGRVKDSFMQHEGNVVDVYRDISIMIANDYGEKDIDVCERVSVTLVTMLRKMVNNYGDLEFKYHG
jgi:hypothetical protein